MGINPNVRLPANGRLLAAAENQFDVLVTTDKNLRYQQNLADRRIAVPVLPTANWPALRAHEARILAAVEALRPGQIVELET